MSLGSWIDSPAAFAADLKRQAHAVRRAVDAMPVIQDPITDEVINPRKRRLCNIAPAGATKPQIVAPGLNPGALDPQRYRSRSR